MAASDERIRWHRVLALLGVLLVVVELVAQAHTWLWAGRPYRSLAKYRWSPYGLVRNNPELTMAGFTVSEDGFRNPRSFAKQKPPHTLRVLLVGGSVLYAGLTRKPVEGAERVASDETIATYLEQSLRADPALAGLDVEVMNAGVNFNRLIEVVTAVLADYLAYEPDVVIVFGSANNFPHQMREGAGRGRTYGTVATHPWAREFERVANRRGFWSLVEHVELSLEGELASVAWARKISDKLLDRAFEFTAARALAKPAPPPIVPAGPAELDGYFRELTALSDALIAAVRAMGGDVAFFWEYHLEELEGLKPLSAGEAALRRSILRARWREERDFQMGIRDRLAAMLAARHVPLVDPLPALAKDSETVFIDYLHYTAHGNQLVAEWLHESLRDVFHERARALR